MYLLLERGHKGSSILSSLFCVLVWPGLPLWWPQDVALVSFAFASSSSTWLKCFLLFISWGFYFLLLVFEIFSLFIWGLCVNFVLLLKFCFFFLCCCLTLCCCCCCCDKPKGAKRHEDDDVLISLLAFHSMTPRCVCSSLIYLYAEVRLAEKRKKRQEKKMTRRSWAKKFDLVWVSFFLSLVKSIRPIMLT